MFVLAHISDIHLAPLPAPRPAELISKRGLGYLNWLRKRRAIHRPEVLEALVADLKAQQPDHIAVTGDLVNLSLANEFAPARAWLDRLGPAARRDLRARQPRRLCRGRSRPSRPATGATTCAATAARAFRSCAAAAAWR